VDAHCRLAREVFDGLRTLVEADLPETEAPVFTIGGSAFQDRAALFLPAGPVVNVLRSGCYVVHDHGTYAEVSPVAGLAPAAVVRALVISAPEPGRVVLNAGKRELAYDAGLPVIVACHRDGAELAGWVGTVAKLFDHHAVVDDAAGLAVGDTVDLGISHPCSLFDRWRNVVAVNGAATETWHPVF
jgi:D-serine deaminase-like pyridoxal phosphate-dependent protein